MKAKIWLRGDVVLVLWLEDGEVKHSGDDGLFNVFMGLNEFGARCVINEDNTDWVPLFPVTDYTFHEFVRIGVMVARRDTGRPYQAELPMQMLVGVPSSIQY